jgi:ketosteroid isomerase-like protein
MLLLGLAQATFVVAQTSAASQDEKLLHQLLDTYAKSIDTLDLTLANQIWSHSPEVSFIQPRGTEKGYDQIVNDFYKATMGMFSERELLLENPDLHIYGDTAWSEMTWTFHATVKDGGPKITTTGRESQVYHKENGAWRIVHIHYSGPPMTGKLKGF